MIELDQLTKRYGHTTAVDHLTFTARPGVVTGYLGPDGAGKSTTMRLLLEAKANHPGRSARDHLLAMAYTHRLSVRRVDGVLDLVGLSGVATHRAGTFSLGMSQRLGIAAALLGDPKTVVLDRRRRPAPTGHLAAKPEVALDPHQNHRPWPQPITPTPRRGHHAQSH